MAASSVGRASSGHPARGGHRAVHRHRLRVVRSGGQMGEVAPGYRLWLHVDGVRTFGPGTQELMERVQATGSLHQAAKLMNMSYTKAWHLLRETEEHLGWKLVERQVGGSTGGGTTLTPKGQDLVRRFARFTAETDAAMRRAFDRTFHDLPTGSGGLEQP